MKPQIVVQDMAGIHAADLTKTQARLVRAGSWKKQRVVVIVPAAATIPAKVYLSHCGLIFPPNQGVIRLLAVGQEVGAAYSNALEFVLSQPELAAWEYVLFLEHDNCPPPDGLIRLLEHMDRNKKFKAIGGLYFTKGPGGVAQIWGDPNGATNFRPQPPRPGELVECCGTGMGFTLFRMSIFKDQRIKRPWFRTLASKDDGVGTQDLSFWAEARKYGHRCAVACDVRVGHYDLDGKFGPPDTIW